MMWKKKKVKIEFKGICGGFAIQRANIVAVTYFQIKNDALDSGNNQPNT